MTNQTHDQAAEHNPYIHEDTGRRNLTALKKQQGDIHARIEQIIALKRDERLGLPIDAEGHALLTRIAGMPAGDPRAREMRYAAKCYSEWDSEAIENILDLHANRHERLLDLEAPINSWHQKLLENSGELAEFINDYPAARPEAQRLRQLARNASKEYAIKLAAKAAGDTKTQPNKSTKALLQSIRGIIRG